MKKAFTIAASAIIAFSGTLAAPVAAENDKGPAKSIVEFCQRFGNDLNGPGLPTAGSCVSYFRTGGAVGFCKQAKDFGVLELYGFETQGECVAALSN